MAVLGVLGLTIGFAAIAVSAACLIGYVIVTRKNDADAERSIGRVGHVAVIIGACALTFCCSILVYAFFAGDYTLNYVLANHSNSTGPLAWLYQFSALWAGREGSLLFWAWLISVFASIIAIRDLKGYKRLDSSALFVISLVLLAFVGVMLFSEDNMPFTSTDESFFASEATLNSAIALYGMNPLLEHWAMAVHPPALFIGYAGMTIPFAYGLGTLICGENSSAWIDRSFKFAVFSLIFLTIGIGLGAIWAYVVLGWGGYWGWDPVENASLLPWLAGIALIHSFTVCRKHGTMKRWCVFCACLAFSFVIVGTFISRSGLVQSVHAFEGDPVSLWLFGSLIVIPLAAGAIGLILRRKSFGVKDPSIPEMESMASKDAAYYFNNVILIAFAVVLTYLTISSALPEIPFLPFSGSSVSSTTYDLIVRPLGVFYLAIFAVCPLLSWSRTDGALFWKRARIPLACGLVIFACLLIYFFMALLPAYNTTIEAGGTNADTLLEQGPSWYYNGIAVLAFLIASLLFCNAIYMIIRTIGDYRRNSGKSWMASLGHTVIRRSSVFGGFIAHASVAIIVIGLAGSSMYVTEKSVYLPYDPETDVVTEDIAIDDYVLTYAGSSVDAGENGADIFYTVYFDVYRNSDYVGQADPSIELTVSTQQQKLNASVLSFATEDLFVVYQGISADDELSIDVKVNPLISFVWAGFVCLVIGIILSMLERRSKRASKDERLFDSPETEQGEDPASGPTRKGQGV